MKLSSTFIAIAFSAALAAPLAASADTTPAAAAPTAAVHRHHHHGNAFMRSLHGVNLSTAQQAQIKSLMQSYRQAHPKGSPRDPVARKQLRQNVVNQLTPTQRTQFEQNMRQFHPHAKHQPGPASSATPTP
ncbi:MAG: hypothetical protein ABI182_01055 [Candidatus Baltobacteraceae bacterium]